MPVVFIILFNVGLIAALVWTLVALVRAQKETEHVRRRLSAYLPMQVVKEVLAREDGRPRAFSYPRATVAVFRIAHFTITAEKLTPEESLRYLNESYLLCGSAVHRHNGIIERLLEDGMVAVFGLGEDADHQEANALRAAIEATRLFAAMDRRWESEGRKHLRIGVGIDTGPLVAGDVGFPERRSYSLVGAVVASAYELQRTGEEINASVVVAAETYEPESTRFLGVSLRQLPLRNHKILRDAYIIRGHAPAHPEPNLAMPISEALITDIHPDPTPEPERPAPPPPTVVPSVHTAFPALLGGHSRYFEADDSPIVPELSVPSMYEDDDGPPVRIDP